MSTSLLFLVLVCASVALSANPRLFFEGKVDEGCTSIGGTCQDYTQNKCLGGYATGLCSGDSNRRCCKPCDATCQSNENSWAATSDSKCKQASGTCMDNSNYCAGNNWSSGMCGGPSTRQCCKPRGGQGNTMTNAGYTLIKCFEGLCLHAYTDVAGIWTIGYGNTRYKDGSAVKRGDTITLAGADDLFAYFVDQDFAPAVDELVGITSPRLTQMQFEALVSFTYNVGTGAFSTSTLLKKVQANPNDPTIRDEFMKWVYAGGQVVQGLVNRRQKEADYYFGNPGTACRTGVESCPN